MTGCIIRVAVSDIMVLIMVLIMVIKDINVVRSGDPVLHQSASLLHHSAPGVPLFLLRLLLCRHGPRYVPLVYKWSSRRWSFGWSNSRTGLKGIMSAVLARGTSPGHSGALAVAVEAAEVSVPSQSLGVHELAGWLSGPLTALMVLGLMVLLKDQPGEVIISQSCRIKAC